MPRSTISNMPWDSASLVAFLVAVSFAAGLNVYVAVAMLGLLSRMHWFALPAGLGGLGNTWVIAAAAALFCVEFFADKIPTLDLVWNALQTVVRLPVAAVLAYRATAHLTPATQFAVTHSLFADRSDRLWCDLAMERLELRDAQSGGAFELFHDLWVVPISERLMDTEEVMDEFSHESIDTVTGAVSRAIGQGES